MTNPILEGKKIVVYDLEIKRPIETLSKGWQSHDEMGISCLCLYDYSTSRYRVFDDLSAKECCDILMSYDKLVGFNTVKFDWAVVKATWPFLTGERKSVDFDILREIWKSKGLDPDVFNPRTHGGFKLDDVAFETLGLRKSGDGAKAPRLFQEGRIAELIDYCIEDVRIEKTLFEFVVNNGHVVRHGEKIYIKYEN